MGLNIYYLASTSCYRAQTAARAFTEQNRTRVLGERSGKLLIPWLCRENKSQKICYCRFLEMQMFFVSDEEKRAHVDCVSPFSRPL